MKLYKFLCIFFCVSLFVSNSYMFTAIGKHEINHCMVYMFLNFSSIGLGIGLKLFIIDNVYRKYPKVCLSVCPSACLYIGI